MCQKPAGSMLDIHCHILPEVDDGASSLEEALRMAHQAAQDGIDKIICTSHLTPSGEEDARLALFQRQRSALQNKLNAEGVPITLLAGAEILFTPEILPCIKKIDVRMSGTQIFLFELPPYLPIQHISTMLFSARLAGLRPILAHPERYPQLWSGVAQLDALAEGDIFFQITGMSLLGEFGKDAQRTAAALCRRFPKKILLGSDAHNAVHRKPLLRDAYEALHCLAPEAWWNATANLSILFS